MQQQLAVIRRYRQTQRQSGAVRNPPASFRLGRLLAAAGVTRAEREECRSVGSEGPRFAFLQELSASAAMAVAMGEAAEHSLFGRKTPQVPRIVTPLQVFVRLLDGWIDEAPHLMAREKEYLLQLMQSAWTLPRASAVPDGWSDRHVALVLLRKIALEWTRRVRQAPAWRSEPSIRSMFSAAVVDAVIAEYQSIACVIGAGASSANTIRQSIRAKSTNAVWVVALIPVVVHGWPEGLNPQLYRKCTDLFGVYVAWVDDIYDLLDDLKQRKWSDTLLKLLELAGCPTTLLPKMRDASSHTC